MSYKAIRPLMVSQITPLVYRDGITLLQLIKELSDYVQNTLQPGLKIVLEQLTEDISSQLDEAVENYVLGVEQFQHIHDAFMADVNARLIALNDNAVTDLVNDDTSMLGEALRSIFPSRTDFDSYRDSVNETLSHAILVNENPVFYVNPYTGNDSNTGEETSPFRTLQHATDVALGTVTRPDTHVEIHLSAGIYPERVQLRQDIGTFNYDIRVIGPDVGGHPNTPLATITQGKSSGIGLGNRNENVSLTVENVLIQGYSGNGIGVLYGRTELDNVHIIDCGIGVDHFSGVLSMPNGIIRECETGIRSIMLNRHNIGKQNNGHRGDTLRIENCGVGFHAQESSTGHVDYVSISDVEVGIAGYVNSRVNATGTSFTDVLVAFRVESNSNMMSLDNEFTRVSTRVFEWNGGYLQDQTQIFGDQTTRQSSIERHGGSNYTRWTSTTVISKFFSKNFDGAWFRQEFSVANGIKPKLKTRSIMKLSGPGEKVLSIMHFGHNSQIKMYAADNGHVLMETETTFMSETSAIITTTIIPHGSNNPRFVILESTRRNDGPSTEIALGASHSEEGASVEVLYTEMSRMH